MRNHICFYLSNHGFGHIARNLPIVIEVLRQSQARVTLVCGQDHLDFARQYLERELSKEWFNRIQYRPMDTDVGLINREGTLLVDTERLATVCERFLSTIPERAASEADWLRQEKVDAALCDMPIWAIDACQTAGIPCLYIGNFTWTELYREFLPEHIWTEYAKHYRNIRHTMLYALHNEEMLEFLQDSEKEETSVVARPIHPPEVEKIRQRHHHPVVFVALGMSAQFNTLVDVSNTPYDFITTLGVPLRGKNVMTIPKTTWNTQDYVAAADYVITKAGWTTVAECILAKRPMALFARDSVLEDRNTIQQLERIGLAVSVTPDDLSDVESVINQMKQLDLRQFEQFYDAANQIAARLISLIK